MRLRCLWLAATFLLAPLALATVPCRAQAADTAGAADLQQRYEALQGELADNPFKRPLYLSSSDSVNAVRGDIYAVLAYPFAQVREALGSPAHWCDILILHLNTKYCRLSTAQGKTMLRMHVGKKTEQDLSATYRLDFSYRGGIDTQAYLSSSMQAEQGPLGTSDYRIRIEAIPLAGGGAFLHLGYSYAYGLASKLALRAYLMTAGRDKVGFTVLQRNADGQPRYVDGARATVERNTMRYYLAIDAYLSGLSAPAPQRLDQRLETWFSATEQYRRQLHEIDRDAYLRMKRNEYARQQQPAD